jgi:hypothetical protein
LVKKNFDSDRFSGIIPLIKNTGRSGMKKMFVPLGLIGILLAALITVSFPGEGSGGFGGEESSSECKILLGGTFSTVGGVLRDNLARLNADGSLDTGFTTETDRGVNEFVIDSEGRILIGGNFTTAGGSPCDRIARLQWNGDDDTSFTLETDFAINVVAVQEY